jgi:hypothetical protein
LQRFLRVARLVADHGADLLVLTLRPIQVADCPKMIVGKLHAVRGIYFPELAR